LRAFLCGIYCGSHTGGLCASFLCDLSPPNLWEGLRFKGFVGARVLEVEVQDL
jgi:hypothetical protein